MLVDLSVRRHCHAGVESSQLALAAIGIALAMGPEYDARSLKDTLAPSSSSARYNYLACPLLPLLEAFCVASNESVRRSRRRP